MMLDARKAAPLSPVENFFLRRSRVPEVSREKERVQVITVGDYAELGQITALRFLEWVGENPEGVVALPTGRTPEYFIKWVRYYRENWAKEVVKGLREEIGPSLARLALPHVGNLRFVQLDEFFPMNPKHERSFQRFVRRYYLQGFELDESKALLLDTYHIPPAAQSIRHRYAHLEEVFPDGHVDLTLRSRHATSRLEEAQQIIIRSFDELCEEYEARIRDWGGIGFFLGGIGPDGHIAFNIRGSSHFSTTRLTRLNYESMATAAVDLGGIEAARQKAVITIGLGTITANSNAVAIIMAAGESKAGVVARSVEMPACLENPASCLQNLGGARFYLTLGAASRLSERRIKNLRLHKPLPPQEKQRMILDALAQSGHTFAEAIKGNLDAAPSGPLSEILDLVGKDVTKELRSAQASLLKKITRGLEVPKNQRILHTAPHHDDIELAYFPLVHHLVRSVHNENHFCYLTSGFTSVTNAYLHSRLEGLRLLLENGSLFRKFSSHDLADPNLGQDDIHGYLNAIAQQKPETQSFYLACRLFRVMANHFSTATAPEQSHDYGVVEALRQFELTLANLSPGQSEPPPIQKLKGWLREWEAELVWAHFGLHGDNVSHMRLPFYSAEIFPEDPRFESDILPIVQLLEKVKPSVVTLAMDPEGSGPDTHFKCLIAVTRALEHYVRETGRDDVRVWGYRNIWSTYHPAEVNTIVPVSLNSFAVLHNMFDTCFLSQRSASFPSPELEGTFSELAQKIWAGQHADLVRWLGRDFFYRHAHPMLRRAYGAIYLNDMSYAEFRAEVEPLFRFLERKKGLPLA